MFMLVVLFSRRLLPVLFGIKFEDYVKFGEIILVKSFRTSTFSSVFIEVELKKTNQNFFLESKALSYLQLPR